MAEAVSELQTAAPMSDELERLVVAVREALTDNMVERLSATTGTVLEVADRLNEPETRDAVHDLFDKLTELHRLGALDTLFESVLLLHAMRSAATDNIVERLFAFSEQMINTLGSDAVADCADSVIVALDEALGASKDAPNKGGIMAAVSLLTKPESQRSLQFLLNFGDALQRNHRAGNCD